MWQRALTYNSDTLRQVMGPLWSSLGAFTARTTRVCNRRSRCSRRNAVRVRRTRQTQHYIENAMFLSFSFVLSLLRLEQDFRFNVLNEHVNYSIDCLALLINLLSLTIPRAINLIFTRLCFILH